MEDLGLYYRDVVAVVAEDPGQATLPDLLQLLQTEPRRLLLVPKSVSGPNPLKLITDNAEECWAEKGAVT